MPPENRHYRGWSFCHILWKCSEVSHRTELHGEAKPIVIAAMEGNEIAIAVIQVEIARNVL